MTIYFLCLAQFLTIFTKIFWTQKFAIHFIIITNYFLINAELHFRTGTVILPPSITLDDRSESPDRSIRVISSSIANRNNYLVLVESLQVVLPQICDHCGTLNPYGRYESKPWRVPLKELLVRVLSRYSATALQ